MAEEAGESDLLKISAPKTRASTSAAKEAKSLVSELSVGDFAELIALKGNEIRNRIIEKQDLLIDSLFQLAEGVKVQGEDGVYAIPPDRNSSIWLLEFAHGKPTQRKELTSDHTITIVSNIPRPGVAELGEGQTIDTSFRVEE